MKKLSALLLVLFFSLLVKAGDSIEIKMNKLLFKAKDSIEFSCTIPNYSKKGLAAVTLNVWIQDLEKTRTWKYRYPVLNGEMNGSLAIGDSIKPGKYAVNFILQRGLFRIEGQTSSTKENSLNYMMRLKNGKKLFNSTSVTTSGNFTVKNILFENEAIIAFTPSKKVKRNELYIFLATPLDSIFTPIEVFTQLIDVKPELDKDSNTSSASYQFNFQNVFTNTTLPDVIVTSVQKRKVDEFNEKYSSGLFQNENKLFSGLENDEISRCLDIETFLQKNLPGLIFNRAEGNAGSGTSITWRGEPVIIYIDEMPLDIGEPIYVSPSDVAMIKVYNPPAAINLAGRTSNDSSSKAFSGAIAIYTKRSNFGLHDNKGRHSFNVKGYTELDSVWR